MQTFIIHILPIKFLKNLPIEVKIAIDVYLEDRQAMLDLTEKYINPTCFNFINAKDYNIKIKKFKERKKESWIELKNTVIKYSPDLDINNLIAQILIYLNQVLSCFFNYSFYQNLFSEKKYV